MGKGNGMCSRPRLLSSNNPAQPFEQITSLTDVAEGTVVRCITRLDETCREVKNAARIIGDPTLFQKMSTCQELIKRYVLTPKFIFVQQTWGYMFAAMAIFMLTF